MRKSTTIGDVLRPTVTSAPNSPAVEAVSGVLSYAELDDRARRAAGALWSLGVRPGDRVAACLPNDLDIVVAFHGAQRIGAIWAGIGEALSSAEQAGLHDLCEPTVTLAGARYTVTSGSRITTDRWAELLDRDESAPEVQIDVHAPAAIGFTSGTSGRPKAVVHSQHNLLLPGAVLRDSRGWGPSLRKGDSFPLTILNLMVLSPLLTAQAGGCAVIFDRRDSDGVIDWITSRRVTVWNGAPAQLYDLARRPDIDLGTLEEVWSGGADTSDALCAEFEAAHGLAPRATYGLTEAPSVVSIDPPGRDHRPRASGQVLGHLDVAAYDDDGHRLPAGELGEIKIAAAGDGRGDGWRPMLGYFDCGLKPIAETVMATGDIGTVDDDGWLSVLDRKKLVIIRGGANVYPVEVERVIATDPHVTRVAVYPVPDERLGQRVAAVVESADGDVDFDSLVGLCRRELSGYKVPEFWSRTKALPVNAMGKVLRADLAEFVETSGEGVTVHVR
ncbi:class I adenylate-forming enzyme family protein [Gordonia sp. CPCC 206044]|uniref:class I adenylate-forming enzyme family protein n=1 Tax=Gordonia sp. CPCC 206044 TaxID=3140793 RepID=UPI003AF359A2